MTYTSIVRAKLLFFASLVACASAAYFGCATGGVPQTEPDGSVIGDGGGKDALTTADGGCTQGATACAVDGGKPICVDTKTDDSHCGSCTNACLPQLQACDAGVCASTCGAKTLCIPSAADAGAPDGGDAGAPLVPHCADLQNDPNDCGQCGTICTNNGTCKAGKCDCGHGTQNFAFTGAVQQFVVPCGITSVVVAAYGGQGANAQDRLSTAHAGGLGGTATGTLTVTPGETLYVNVGGQGNTNGSGGFNGGASGGTSTAGTSCSGGPAGGGGGMSDVRRGGSALSNIVIAAGGGGGSGRDYCNGSCQPCGCGGGSGGGGGSTGTNGGAAAACGYGYPGSNVNGGQGGQTSAGGTGGPGDGNGPAGTAGTQGAGGGGANGSLDVAGGGGGGGYYGGGGGGSAANGSGVGGGGGGGGAAYITGLTSASTSAGVQSGDGKISITW